VHAALLEQIAQAGAEEVVVVDQEDAGAGRLVGAWFSDLAQTPPSTPLWNGSLRDVSAA